MVGNNISINTSIYSGHFLSLNPDNLYDNTTLELLDKTTGSYTDLQSIIDSTPIGGILNLTFNVTYDPIGDAWLQSGMRLNKTITILGNNNTISGGGMARIFINDKIDSNATLTDINFVNGYYGEGGAIYSSNGNMLTVINSTFYNNTATGSGGGAAIFSTGA